MTKKRAVTLTEVIVGAVILALTFGGVLAAFVGARTYVARADRRLAAANLARAHLNTLYVDVRQDTWNTGNLRQPLTRPFGDAVIGGITYGRNYVVREVVSNGVTREYRNVTMNVVYPVD